MRTLLPTVYIRDGMWCLRLISTIRTPLDTGYRYALVHCSFMSFTSPCLVKMSFTVRSGISGGRSAILILLVPIPASYVDTCYNAPLSCWNSSFPSVSISTDCIRVLFVNLRRVLAREFGSYVHHPQPTVILGDRRESV